MVKSSKKEKHKSPATPHSAAAAIELIKSRFGEGSIMTLTNAPRQDVDVISTGCLSIDLALGVGGVPRGRIIEIYGPEASGKTTLALHIVREAQAAGGVAAFVDAEHALDPVYASKIGVNLGELLVSQPDNGEQALDIVETLVRSNAIDVIVVDSVAALTPKAEIEGEMGATHVGLQARLMSQALRKLTALISRSKTVVIFINQIRMKIGVMFGNPETTTGGNSLKFYSSVRMEIRRAAQIKAGDAIVGNRVKVKVVKNKVAAPFRTAEFDIMYNEGISASGDLVDLGALNGVLTKSGNSYSFGETKLGMGREAAKATIKANPELQKEITAKIKEKIQSGTEEPQSGAEDEEDNASEELAN